MSSTEQLGTSQIALRNVLFAMDLSPGSLLAFPAATSIARQYRGKVFVAHIIPAEDYYPLRPGAQATVDTLELGAAEGLIRASGGLHDVPYEVLTDHGNISLKLLDIVERYGIDLIVLGTHGWQGLKKLLKGSRAEEIVLLANRPVMTVGPKASWACDFKRVLYETDFSPAAAHAIPFVSSLAQAYRMSVLVLHVNDWDSKESPATAEAKTYEFVHDQISSQGALARNVEVVVKFGPRSEQIVEVAATRRADLIVLGLNGSKGIKARIAAHLPGSTAYDVVSEARCPVLTVPFASSPRESAHDL